MEEETRARWTGELEPFIGEWYTEAMFPAGGASGVGGRTAFEWMPGRQFVVQRWEVKHPDAPDGIAVIGFDVLKQTYVQHYFDSRGVARLYEMGFDGDAWTLSRTDPDFSPLDFFQRFTATFSDDDRTIEGSWEISHDGSVWQRDFDLRYRKLT